MKDFEEFVEVSNNRDFRERIARQSHDEVERIQTEEGRILSDAEMAVIYSHDLTIALLQLYHEWVNL